jgi:hypothetical protein
MDVDIVFGSDLIFCEFTYSFNNAALVLVKVKERESAATNNMRQVTKTVDDNCEYIAKASLREFGFTLRGPFGGVS